MYIDGVKVYHLETVHSTEKNKAFYSQNIDGQKHFIGTMIIETPTKSTKQVVIYKNMTNHWQSADHVQFDYEFMQINDPFIIGIQNITTLYDISISVDKYGTIFEGDTQDTLLYSFVKTIINNNMTNAIYQIGKKFVGLQLQEGGALLNCKCF